MHIFLQRWRVPSYMYTHACKIMRACLDVSCPWPLLAESVYKASRLAPTVTAFMCVNALTTCPDGEVETFMEGALEEFTSLCDFSASVEPFWSHWVSLLECHHSIQIPNLCSDLFPKWDIWIVAKYFRTIFIIVGLLIVLNSPLVL